MNPQLQPSCRDPAPGRVVNSTTSVQYKPPCVWTDTVQGRHSTVWSRRLALPYGTEGGQFVLQFDLRTSLAKIVYGFREKYPLFHREKYYIRVSVVVSSQL